MTTMPFNKCPICGGDIREKQVEKILKGGQHTAVLTTKAAVCLHCGERLYDQETVKRFEQIRQQLKKYEVSNLEPMGTSFKVA